MKSMKYPTHLYKLILISLIFYLILAGTNSAFSSTEESREGLYFPFGINVNYHHEDKVNFGFELGSAYFYGMENKAWIGSYGDFTTDLDEYRFSIGSEFGYAFLGFDIGYGGLFTEDGYRHAVTGRFLVPIPLCYISDPASSPIIIPYVRYTIVIDDENFLEYGVLVKYSIRFYDPNTRY